MRNLLKRRPRDTAKPTLRERAGILKATAGRVLRRPADLPAPGTDAARAAFAAACREHTRLTVFAREGYSHLRRSPNVWWTKDSLGLALDTGEVSPADYARLHPIASERELRVEAISHRLNLGALFALAHAGDYPQEVAAPEEADRAAMLADLLALYAEDRAGRPIEGRGPDTVAGRAAVLVQRKVWASARGALALSPPRTRDGLALAGLASAILVESDCGDLRDPATCAVAGLTRAVLAFTGTAEPAGFCGLGSEADFHARDRALYAGTGSVPAWAVAEIEAEDRAALPAPSDAALLALEAEFKAADDVCLAASEAMAAGRGQSAEPTVGPDALEAAYDAADHARRAVLQRLRGVTADGLVGLAVKARVVASMGSHDDPKADALRYSAGTDRGLVLDLMGDVLAVADKGPASPLGSVAAAEAPEIKAAPRNIVPPRVAAVLADPSPVVEARLLALSSSYESFALAQDAANAFEARVGVPLPHNADCAHGKALTYAHAGMVDAIQHAMALPATTLRALGLQARILERDAITLWEDNDTDLIRCHALLRGLIAAAGLSPIETQRVGTDEIRGWLADPATAPGAVPASEAEG